MITYDSDEPGRHPIEHFRNDLDGLASRALTAGRFDSLPHDLAVSLDVHCQIKLRQIVNSGARAYPLLRALLRDRAWEEMDWDERDRLMCLALDGRQLRGEYDHSIHPRRLDRRDIWIRWSCLEDDAPCACGSGQLHIECCARRGPRAG